MDTLFDVINIIDTAILYSQNISYSTLEKKREAIQAQHDVVKQIPKKIYNNNKKYDKDIKYAEIEKNLKKFPDRSTQGLEGTNLRDALFNRGQRIRIYLSFFINKFAGGETKPRSDDLTNLEKKYKKQPDAALNDLISENGKDIQKLKAALGLYSDSEIKKIQRRKRFGIGGRKSRKKRRKRKLRRKTKNKKGGHHEAIVLGALALSKIFKKKKKKKKKTKKRRRR
tara:strand:+ start:358 stop:1035 length:678 start_codon:yes stop_codon:yes gene_type:complete